MAKVATDRELASCGGRPWRRRQLTVEDACDGCMVLDGSEQAEWGAETSSVSSISLLSSVPLLSLSPFAGDAGVWAGPDKY